MTSVLNIGSLTVTPFGLFVSGAAILFSVLVYWFTPAARRRELPVFLLSSVVLSLLCSRMLYCLCHIDTYIEDYGNAVYMLRFWDGGYSIYGIFAGCTLAAYIHARASGTAFSGIMDITAVSLPLPLALLYYGQYSSELGVGKLIEEGFFTRCFSWLLYVEDYGSSVEYRLNASLISCLFCVILGLVLIVLLKKRQSHSGDITLIFFILFGSFGLMLESIRDDGHMLLIAFLRAGQLFCTVMLISSFICLCRRIAKITGKGTILVSVLFLALAAAIIVLTEFMIDGRVTLFPYHLWIFYLIMFICCLILALIPLLQLSICSKISEKH